MATLAAIGQLDNKVQQGLGIAVGMAAVQAISPFMDQLVNSVASQGFSSFTPVINIVADLAGVLVAFSMVKGGDLKKGFFVGMGTGFSIRAVKDLGSLLGVQIPSLGVSF
jgi:hypothetical protein